MHFHIYAHTPDAPWSTYQTVQGSPFCPLSQTGSTLSHTLDDVSLGLAGMPFFTGAGSSRS